ncbi:evolutionarily conserved signaling intermediate in Toll pathway, mitochondrial [Galendromus occidentalis]|uniref:Evolutionarily conserved signaling intermediate in Toll pathway, mitochondrial n=1 Tax=Galendromus occidentalis TaxID=34638 RepID=A0AAJ6W007_9ACAR|nr:evolutionarily conserved signaling intermediate in Toll pathway, mitochondrial [Galendromus occidentalis]
MAVSLWRSRLTSLIHRQVASATSRQFSQRGLNESMDADEKRVTVTRRRDSFAVESDEVKDKRLFMQMVEKFKAANPNRRGHIEFIEVALKHVEEFQVHADMSVYKALFDLFPRDKLRPKNLTQAAFVHFPRHQDCALHILKKMSEHRLIPDQEFRLMILDIFGPETHVFKLYCRMMYWMPKFSNASPYRLPKRLPRDAKELALLGIQRITGVDRATEIEVFEARELTESLDKTWIVSGQSWKQRELLLEESGKNPLKIEGPFTLWMKPRAIQYFTLIGEPRIKPEVCIETDDVSNLKLRLFGEKEEPTKDITNLPSVHEQLDGTVFACCATGTSSRDSLLSWLRFLQRRNPVLERLPTVFKLRAPSEALVNVDMPNKSEQADAWAEESAQSQ